jgi:hypothetical protein
MNAMLLRKECRELLPWAILAVAVGLVEWLEYVTWQVDMRPLGSTFGLLNDGTAIVFWLVAFAIGTGLVTREHDAGTLAFLDGLPVSRARVFFVKCALMAALVLIPLAMRFAMLAGMHLLSRGPLTEELHAALLARAFAVEALLVLNGLMLGAALGRLRSLTWLVAGILAAALLLLEEQLPQSLLLNPISLLEWQWTSTALHVPVDAVVAQLIVTLAAFAIAWRGFMHAGRGRPLRLANRPVLGAVVTVATVAAGLTVFMIVSLQYEDPMPVAPVSGEPYRFAAAAPAQTATEHYRFSYPADEAEAALALAADADAIFERVHAMLGVPLGARIDVDASGSARNTHGTAFFDRLRMTLASEVRPVLAHETAHVVATRVAGGRSAWLWGQASVLSEGVASWVESEFRAPSTRADDRLFVLAALQARRELSIDELASPALLGMVRDENIKYPAGEALIGALVRIYGEDAIPRLLAAFTDPALPTDLGGYALWQSTFQLAGFDLAAVVDEFYRTVTAYADANAERIAALPRPRLRLVSAGGGYGVVPLLDGPGGAVDDGEPVVLRFKPLADSPSSQFQTVNGVAGRPSWRGQFGIAGGRICVQAGIRVGGEVLFEPWSCLPTSGAEPLGREP